ncbi:MAG: guanylate kinase [Victivallales bacterium]|nr:guanylate kinase [Victivallales bacterium]
MKRLGTAIILSGPSGVGKSTVCSFLFKKYAELKFSVSCTTRAPRPGEVDGVAYHFLTIDEFKRRIDAGDFLEWAEVHGNYYGTLKQEVKPRVINGQDIILDIDVQGMRLVRKSVLSEPEWSPSVISVFLAPPSLAALEQRLRGRGTETEESIQKRLGNAAKELAAWREYDYIVVNDVAEQAANRLDAILTAAHARTATRLEAPWLA